ncbi:YbfB/YjiJ family MFS transporter [Pseudovibrio exalbescens]|uniref:YbfB/YjiJ family MFS transporter n=1 Tax=Pseudovibrio exalbescens TaxID=197461 RepID=UPI0023663A86|nr:YbfB/YjiJ family MFS transporter [Pseudovibrio exalbescens]MDD7909180.1 YbfB/YjiJ family MFS transporter [Pseudovibrio exalbescens]
MFHNRTPFQLALGGCLALATVMGIGRFVYTPILPWMLLEGRITEVSAGLIASSNFIGYLLGAILASRSPLPGGAYRVFTVGLFLTAFTTLIMAVDGSTSYYSLVRFLSGLISAYVFVLASTLIIPRLHQLGRVNLTPVIFAGVGLGISLSSLFIELADGWVQSSLTLWLISGIISFVLIGGVLWLFPAREAPVVRTNGAAASREPALPRVAYRLIIAYGFFGFGYVITATFLGALAATTPGLENFATRGWLLVGLAIMPSVFLWNSVALRIGYGRAIAVACLLEAVGVALSVLMPNLIGLSLAAILLGGTFVGITAIGLVEARRLAPDSPRSIIGLMTAAFGLGQVIGPTFSGYLFEWTGSFTEASLVAAATLIIAALLTIKPFNTEALPAPSERREHA